MADSIKISELPELAGVDPDDIVPVVDKTLSQTSRVTAADIAAIGGGPPGDGTVVTSSIVDGAVTAIKVGFTGPDKIITRIDPGPGGGVETTCTPFARTLLTAIDQPSFLQLSGFSGPTFSDPVKGADGTAAAPGYTFADDQDTGIFSPADNQIGFATGGVSRFVIDENGVPLFALRDDGTLRPATFVRAQVAFNPSVAPLSMSGDWGVLSVTYTGSGRYTVNFEDVMPDTHYTVAVTSNDSIEVGDPASSPGNTVAANIFWIGNKTTTGFGVQVRQWDFNYGNPRWQFSDPSVVNVTVFR